MIKYLCFEELKVKTKTKQFTVKNNITYSFLGYIKWYAPWRRYCFFTNLGLIFDAGCLFEIKDFIDKLMAERKK